MSMPCWVVVVAAAAISNMIVVLGGMSRANLGDRGYGRDRKGDGTGKCREAAQPRERRCKFHNNDTSLQRTRSDLDLQKVSFFVDGLMDSRIGSLDWVSLFLGEEAKEEDALFSIPKKNLLQQSFNPSTEPPSAIFAWSAKFRKRSCVRVWEKGDPDSLCPGTLTLQ
jgi:hypothetical protein